MPIICLQIFTVQSQLLILPRIQVQKINGHVQFCRRSIKYFLIELTLQNVMDTNDAKSADQVLNNLDKAKCIYQHIQKTVLKEECLYRFDI